MSVIGNDPTVGGERARRQCESAILAQVNKLQIMVAKTQESWDRAYYLAMLESIVDKVGTMERLRIHEEQEPCGESSKS